MLAQLGELEEEEEEEGGEDIHPYLPKVESCSVSRRETILLH